MVERLDIQRTTAVYGAVAKELPGTGAGETAKRASALPRQKR